MRKASTLIAFMLLLVFSGAAGASESYYVVKKGDYLSKIAKNWKAVAKLNNIKGPKYFIYPGQKILLPDLAKIKKVAEKKSREFRWIYPARDKYKGSVDQALKLLNYPEDVAKLLKFEVKSGSFENIKIRKGDRFAAMTFGKNKVRKNVVAAWKNKSRVLSAKKYTIKFDGVEYSLTYPLVCGNWTRLEDKKIITIEEAEMPAEVAPEAEVTPSEEIAPQAVVAPPSEEEKALEAEEVPALIEKPEECCIEHEPTIGAGVWENGIAEGRFAYGEYMVWLKTNCASEYSYGLGVYGMLEDGESKLSAYEWKGYGIGFQTGIKRYWLDHTGEKRVVGVDEDGNDVSIRVARARQWTVKARIIWEHTDGENPESGYHMRQSNAKLGLYAEYIRELDDRWQMILIGEGWHALDKSIKSTWSGDKPANRNQLMVGLYGQYKIDEAWQLRFGAAPFYQGWDNLKGIHFRAEARYKEVVMFGPYFNFFPWKSSAYKGVPLHDLQTWGAFVRVEFGPIIRKWDQEKRMERVKLIDYEELGIY